METTPEVKERGSTALVIEEPKKRGRRAKELTFDWREDANKALAAAKEAAVALGKADVTSSNRRRALLKALWKLIFTLATIDELNKCRMVSGETEPRPLPKRLVQFFKENGIPPPHLNSANPFQPLYKHFRAEGLTGLVEEDVEHVSDELERMEQPAPGASFPPAEELVVVRDTTRDGEKVSAERKMASFQAIESKYALLLCAAIDQNNPALLNMHPNVAIPEYNKWRFEKGQMTLARPPKLRAATTRKDTVDATPDDTERETAAMEDKPDPESAEIYERMTVEPGDATGGETVESDKPVIIPVHGERVQTGEDGGVVSEGETAAETVQQAASRLPQDLSNQVFYWTPLAEPKFVADLPLDSMPDKGIMAYELRDGQLVIFGYGVLREAAAA